MSTKNRLRRNNLGVSTIGFVGVVVILLVVAAGGFALYATKASATTTITSTISSTTTETETVAASNTSLAVSQVTALAYSHWASVGSKNLTAVMSQYSPSAVLGWYVNPASALNGTYTNSSAIQNTWTKFFDANPTTYYTIYNYSLTFNGSIATVNAVIWYVLGNGTVTLKLPYELNYQLQNGSWALTGDWWGLPNQPGTIVHEVAPIITATTSVTTSTSTETTTASTTSSTTQATSA